MNIKITENGKSNNEYPCFKRLIPSVRRRDGRDKVVLFTQRSTGTVVAVSNDDSQKVGYHTGTWAEDDFAHFNGTIEISD